MACGWLALMSALGADAPPLYALIVAGGPDEEDNAAQIEGHARYVGQLLPPGTQRIVLFADGKTDGAKVCYVDTSPEATARQALGVLLTNDDEVNKPDLRPLQLGLPLDGAAAARNIHHAIGKLAVEAEAHPGPILLFFAGHGSPAATTEPAAYDLWDEGELDVHQLAKELARLPHNAPVVLVMAQCFSGAFGNVVFTGGDPKQPPVQRDIAGFFSTTPDREASGCSWETGEADYQDFSSYFFGALSGRDRFGHPVTGADFDGDGHVTMHEAFCYALIHDISIDTPVCTSQVFLAHSVKLASQKIFSVPYAEVAAEASPAQRAALEALSQRLGVSGAQRALAVMERLDFADPLARNFQLDAENSTNEKLNALRLATLETLFKDCPDLRWSGTPGYEAAVQNATKELTQNQALCRNLLDTQHTSDIASGAVDDEEADLTRFRGLYASIVRARELREHGSKADQARFQALWQAEQATLPLGKP